MPTPTPPTEPELAASPKIRVVKEDPPNVWMNYCTFNIKLNKAAENTVKAKLKLALPAPDDPDPYDPDPADMEVTEYTPDITTLEDGVWTTVLHFSFPPELTWQKTATLVVDYTREDGTAGTYESDPFTLYGGNYVFVNSDAVVYDGSSGTLSIPFYIDRIVDINKVSVTKPKLEYRLLLDDTGSITVENPEITRQSDEDRQLLILKFSGVNLNPGSRYLYTIDAVFEYTDDTFVWVDSVLWSDTIDG